MDWLCINIYLSHEGIEPLTAALMEIGITSIVINDPMDIDNFVENKTAEWDYIDESLADTTDKPTYVTVYLENNIDGLEQLSNIKASLERLKSLDVDNRYGELSIDTSNISEQDWANNWKQFFKPVEIGERILIKPTWEPVPDNNDRVIVELDPESSFGTGRHFTTQICLELLEKYLKHGDRIADLGCGSGIISIAGMMLGAKSSACTDIAENAVKIAAENAVKNGIAPENYTVYLGDIASDKELLEEFGKGFDLVAANIVADVLLSMTDVYPILLKDGGYLVVSGIIDGRQDEVFSAIKAKGFTLVESLCRDIWNGAVFVRG